MENFIIKLYKKYLYDHISHDEFLEMRHVIENTRDVEFSHILKEEWNENISQGELSKEAKTNIKRKLDFYIENDKKRIARKRVFQIAAVVIPFIVFSSILIFRQLSVDNADSFIVSVQRGNKALVTLPDQSKVWLNSNTVLEYNRGEKNTREVRLSGEAFFKVFKDIKQPFIITLNNLQVEVLGTSFNVKAREGSDIIETSLVEGSIKLQGTDLSQDYYLKPNEKAIYSQSTKQIQIMKTDNDIETAWKDDKLKFNSERFVDVMSMLEDWYNVKIICKCPEIENDLMSGTFKYEKLETILDAIKMQYNIRYIRNKDTIIVVSNN